MATIGQSEYLKTWVDKYGAIMRRADCELEFKDQVYVNLLSWMLATAETGHRSSSITD